MKFPEANKINAEKYVAGLSLFKQKAAKIKLSANESALGPSPKAIREYLNVSKNFRRYPDSDGNFLRSLISKKFRLKKDQILLGAGSDQVYELICKAFLDKNSEVIVSKFSFIIYRIYSKINNAKIKYAKEENFKFSVKNILSLVNKNTKIVFIANPNNPTGTYISKKELIFLRKKLPSNILLAVDDAYFEYVNNLDYKCGLDIFKNYKNVIVTRTFSKIYGLAGLRIGWGYSSKKIIQSLNQIKPPFNVSRPALFAASAALQDSQWLRKEIKHVRKWSKIFDKEFKKLGIFTNKSNANFSLVNFSSKNISAKKIFSKLAKRGILVRNMDVYGINNSLRITIGTSKENETFLKTLKNILHV